MFCNLNSALSLEALQPLGKEKKVNTLFCISPADLYLKQCELDLLRTSLQRNDSKFFQNHTPKLSGMQSSLVMLGER